MVSNQRQLNNHNSHKPLNPPFVFRDPNNYSRIYGTAHTLDELVEILPLVPFSVIENHLYRLDRNNMIHCDLCEWITFILGLTDLAQEVRKIGIYMNDPMKAKKELIALLREYKRKHSTRY